MPSSWCASSMRLSASSSLRSRKNRAFKSSSAVRLLPYAQHDRRHLVQQGTLTSCLEAVQFIATSMTFPSFGLKIVKTKYCVPSQAARIEPSLRRTAPDTLRHAGKLYLIIREATVAASPFGAAPTVIALATVETKNPHARHVPMARNGNLMATPS